MKKIKNLKNPNRNYISIEETKVLKHTNSLLHQAMKTTNPNKNLFKSNNHQSSSHNKPKNLKYNNLRSLKRFPNRKQTVILTLMTQNLKCNRHKANHKIKTKDRKKIKIKGQIIIIKVKMKIKRNRNSIREDKIKTKQKVGRNRTWRDWLR